MKSGFDIEANRSARKWSQAELLGRVLWAFALPLFSCSPKLFWGWRRLLLRLFRAKIGNGVRIFPSVRIMIPGNLTIEDNATIGDRVILYALGPLRIGKRAIVSQGAHLCGGTHDHRCADFPLVKSSITIGEAVWVCADAFIGPDVMVGDHAVVGARSVVMKDVVAKTIVAGNPARHVGDRPEIQPAAE
jgi:putative colanic acid biosynthesis acetyltransferase WcaF